MSVNTATPVRPLEEVATIERDGIAAGAIPRGTLYVGLEHMDSDGGFVGVRAVDAGELASNKFRFGPRHILFGKLRPYLRKTARPEFEGICSTDILPILPGPELDRDYLFHFLRHPKVVEQAVLRCAGANLPRISPRDLATFGVPVPPLGEQRRIAAILDKADAIRRKRRGAIAITEELLRSAFLEMFGDPVTNPKGWQVEPFDRLVAETQLGLVRAAADQGDARAYPYVRMNAIRSDGHLDVSDLARVDATDEEVSKSRLHDGDFLFNTRNSRELVGKAAVFHGAGVYLFNNNILRVRFRPGVESDFVSAYWQTSAAQRQLDARKAGTTSVFAIYYKSLATLSVTVPPAAAQRKFADLSGAARQSVRTQECYVAEAERLFNALTVRAFSGRAGAHADGS